MKYIWIVILLFSQLAWSVEGTVIPANILETVCADKEKPEQCENNITTAWLTINNAVKDACANEQCKESITSILTIHQLGKLMDIKHNSSDTNQSVVEYLPLETIVSYEGRLMWNRWRQLKQQMQKIKTIEKQIQQERIQIEEQFSIVDRCLYPCQPDENGKPNCIKLIECKKLVGDLYEEQRNIKQEMQQKLQHSQQIPHQLQPLQEPSLSRPEGNPCVSPMCIEIKP